MELRVESAAQRYISPNGADDEDAPMMLEGPPGPLHPLCIGTGLVRAVLRSGMLCNYRPWH